MREVTDPGLPKAVREFLDQGGKHVVLATAQAPVVDGALPLPDPALAGRYARVLVAVADRADLRAAVVPWAVRAPVVALWVGALASSPGLLPRPEWPPLVAFRTQPVGEGYLVVARFAQPVRAANVVSELARVSVWPAPQAAGGLVVDDGSGPGGPVEERDVPPDVVLGDAVHLVDPVHPVHPVHPVTGRAAYSTGVPALTESLDERVFNPTGFVADVDGPVQPLESLVGSWPGGRRPDEAVVRGLRGARGVRGSWQRPEDAAFVVSLAMSGVPVSLASVSPAVAASIDADLLAALVAPVDLDDVVAREEHSIVLRRAAMRAHSSAAWRRRMAALAGVRVAGEPTVSVVLATRRPEMLAFALRQVRKQRGVDLQLVLAPHGFSADPDVVRASGLDRVVVRPHEESVPFGDVLADATSAADGDLVLKMDDDDWYGPDFVTDLLMARAYSGAQLVGTSAEFHYLVPKETTVRRGHKAELYAHFVAGGTILVERGLLREVGSFRSVRKYVDAQLLRAVVRTGAAIYRTHGLGYLLRRNAAGHTWQVDMDYLLDPVRTADVRPGFAPSRLLTYDPSELPTHVAG
jgi:hypothetical protein